MAEKPKTDTPIVSTGPVESSGPVQITSTAAPPGVERMQRQSTDPSLPATTTFQEDLRTAGQRHINVMWEGTQKQIALSVTYAALLVCAFLIIWPGIPTELKLMAFTTVSNVFFAITSVYFTRTNHKKVGGVGANETGR